MLIKRICCFLIINLCHPVIYATSLPLKSTHVTGPMSAQPEGTYGSKAESLTGLGMDLSNIFKTASMMTGIAILLFAMIQLGKYRKNPVETPISKVITTMLIGLGLIALSFIPMRLQY